MQIKNIASSVVLGLLFFSLLVIFLVSGADPLVTSLSVLIVAICLVVTLTGDWRAIGVIGVLAAIVSLVAANLYGQQRFGDFGGFLVPIVWGLALLGAWVWISQNVITVPNDQAVLTRRTFSGEIITQTEPIGLPTLPLLDRPLATIPLYTLTTESVVKSLYTKNRQTIVEIPVTISYRVMSRDAAEITIKKLPNRRLMQEETAKSLGKSVDEARLDVRYWERLLDVLMKDVLDDVARDVVRYKFNGAKVAYQEQKRLEILICDSLNLSVDPWGIKVTRLQIDKVEITDKDWSALPRETDEMRLKAQYDRVRNLHNAQHDAEAERVKKLIAAVREAGIEDIPIPLLEDIIVSATSDPSDRVLDAELSRWLSATIEAGDKKQ
ncbi:MAG: hypothetical protein H7Z42_14995 [Roseiflexaceae bacterium]|nr:hypothetical protein [Roseiflexaceae bacterium]